MNHNFILKILFAVLIISLISCGNDHHSQNKSLATGDNIIIVNSFLKKKIVQYIEYLPLTQEQNRKNTDTIIVEIQRQNHYYYIELYNDSPRYYYGNLIGMNNYSNGVQVFFLFSGYKNDNPFLRVIKHYKYAGPTSSNLERMLHDLPYPAPWDFYFKGDSLIKQSLPEICPR